MNVARILAGRGLPHIIRWRNASFKSRYSLERVYPCSSLDITTPANIPAQSGGGDNNEFSGYIPMERLDITYSTSGGPGGQNVNKVQTKVDLRFHVDSAEWFPQTIKPKFINKYHTMINKEGFLVIKSERTRSQMLNVADCLDKLRFMIRDAAAVPRQPTEEDETTQLRRHEKACRERLREKRLRSSIKQGRAAPTADD